MQGKNLMARFAMSATTFVLQEVSNPTNSLLEPIRKLPWGVGSNTMAMPYCSVSLSTPRLSLVPNFAIRYPNSWIFLLPTLKVLSDTIIWPFRGRIGMQMPHLLAISGVQTPAANTTNGASILPKSVSTPATRPVSYTHLDVYKRQYIHWLPTICMGKVRPGARFWARNDYYIMKNQVNTPRNKPENRVEE